MTALADSGTAARAGLRPPAGVQVWLAVLAGLALLSLPNLADPMIRYDDFPALLGHAETFWPKTLHEGRWINYLWHLRGALTPAWLNFALYQALWAGFAACTALILLPGTRVPAIVAALMLVIAPPATLISLWFNTLIPGLALVALYAWLGTWARPVVMHALMPVFVVLSFMAYTTYPLLILTICLLCTERHAACDLIGTLGLFGASFLAAVLAVYTLNWQVHGIFGVPLADWRAAVPAADLGGVAANLPLVWQSFMDLADKASFGFAPMLWFHLALFGAATAAMLRARPGPALYLLAALGVGIALVVVQVLKMGALVPPRGFIFLWVIYALMAGGALAALEGGGARWMRNAVFLVIGSYGLQTFLQYQGYRAWQAETRAVAAALSGGPKRLLVAPEVKEAASARQAFVQDPLALAYRLTQLTARPAGLCAGPDCLPDVSLGADGQLVPTQAR